MEFEAVLRGAWESFPTHTERTITHKYRRSIAGLRSRDFGEGGFAIHCARYVDRQGVGTIPMAPAEHADLGERSPEEHENFLNTDFMALVRGDHLIVLNCGRNAGGLRLFAQELFKKAGMDDAANQFDLVRIGRPDQLALIERVGVKSIDVEVGISDATAAYLEAEDPDDGPWAKLKRGIGSVVSAIAATDDTVAEIRSSETGTVSVSIDIGKGDLAIARGGLSHYAESIAEDEEADGYVIVLEDRTRITPIEMAVSKLVRLDEFANSVSVTGAWDEMNVYMNELFETGQIEA